MGRQREEEGGGEGTQALYSHWGLAGEPDLGFLPKSSYVGVTLLLVTSAASCSSKYFPALSTASPAGVVPKVQARAESHRDKTPGSLGLRRQGRRPQVHPQSQAEGAVQLAPARD